MYFNWQINARTTLDTGVMLGGSTIHMATPEYYYAKKGTSLDIVGCNYLFNIATYSTDFDESFMHEYKYLPDSAYLTYNQDLDITQYSADKYVFAEDTYFRICLKRVDGKDISDKFKNQSFVICGDNKNNDNNDVTTSIELDFDIPQFYIEGIIYDWEYMQSVKFKHNPIFDKECDRISNLINTNHGDNSIRLILASDSHFAIRGTFEQSAYNMRKMAKMIDADAMLHLGDFTDGILCKWLSIKYTKYVLNSLPKPLYICLGNHDANYFSHNKLETMSVSEQCKEYLDSDKPYYYVDIKGVRLIFLDCYDNDREHRYGYTDEELIWLENLLKYTDKNIMVFGHCPPMEELDYWAKKTHNGDWLIQILQEYHQRAENASKVLAYINGHVHSENINISKGFPIITIGCNKCEDFKTHKPNINITYDRKLDDITQELFYVLVIDNDWDGQLDNDNMTKRLTSAEMDDELLSNSIYLYRFGAGEDRWVTS